MKIIQLLVAGVLAGTLGLCAEVKPGDNILLNGRFETDQTEMPLFWQASSDRFVKWQPSSGPAGIPAVKFVNDGTAKTHEVTFRQYGIGLVSNASYRMSIKVRTRNFKCRSSGALVVDNGWYHSAGFSKFAETQDWTTLSQTVKMIGSNNGVYSAVLYAIDFTGEIEFADFQLEALDAAALKGTTVSSVGQAARRPRLVPWSPILCQIPKARPEVEFRFFGRVDEGTRADYVVELATPQGRTSRPLANRMTLPLPPQSTSGEMCVTLSRPGRPPVFSQTYPFAVVDVPVVAPRGHRRLNNLVTEVLSEKVSATPGEQVYTFTTVKTGWTFTRVQAPADADFTVRLDGRPVMDAATPRLETFREIPAGTHTLAVKGAAGAGRVIVRSIAEIFNYCPGVNSLVKENPPYDWDFQMKYVLPAVTTQNGGNIPREHRAWFAAQGYKWLANLGTTKLTNEVDLTARLAKAGGMTNPEYDGVTCDEQFFGQPGVLEYYTKGLRAYANPKDRLIYTWIVGKPGTPGVDADFISASLNASRGRGKLMFEAYCRTKGTEEEARTYLGNYVTDTLEKYRACYPLAGTATGIAFGNFNQIPILALTHHPEVDYKYYLDMQLNLVANDPAFAGLACTGYWGSYYADHELHRWAFMLLRHYCVEGETSMLSAKYGFSYLPGLLKNGDFRETFAPWTVSGDVARETIPGFGSRSQNRWGGNGSLGDTCAVLKKTAAGEPATVKQTIAGLVPGRAYCLQFATFDVKDAKAKKIAPRLFPVDATLSAGAEIRPDLSWVHVDKRIKGRYAHNDGVARINLRHTVFIARAAEAELVFSNARAAAGEELGINCVSLNPFLLDD